MASKVSSEVRIVTSASASPSVTVTLPSETSTFHLPAPSTSKRYELFIPAVLPESTRASRPSKNSRVICATGGRLQHIRDRIWRHTPGPLRRRQERRERDRRNRHRRTDVQRRSEIDGVRERAE